MLRRGGWLCCERMRLLGLTELKSLVISFTVHERMGTFLNGPERRNIVASPRSLLPSISIFGLGKHQTIQKSFPVASSTQRRCRHTT